jgi:hypothetical protein
MRWLYMDKNTYDFKQLIAKYHRGECSNEENAVLESWMIAQLKKSSESPIVEDIDAADGRMRAVIQRRTGMGKTLVIRFWPRIVAAASIGAVLMLGFYFSNDYKRSSDINSQPMVQDIAPGKNGATLTLANGQKILIEDALSGKIATESGVTISKTPDGQIVYEIVDNIPGKIAYNTLSTTRGEQTQVRLPDGTLVFLNAESSITYPTSFARSDRRQVTFKGEAYFEVAQDKQHPFIVNARKQSVEVLGTHFNIESYDDKLETKTTLVEGSVKIRDLKGRSKMLKPNQQAILSEGGITVVPVEAEYEVAWKEGFFMFNNESLESIMSKICRWYKVKVVYEDESLKKTFFIGTINRFENISNVLKILEKTKVAEFTINKTVLTIKRKSN